MKKFFVIFGMLIAFCVQTSAAEAERYIDLYKRGHDQKSTTVHRAPARLSVTAIWFEESRQVEVVTTDDSLVAEVYVYDSDNNIVAYSSSLNTVLDLSFIEGNEFMIKIVAEDWEAIGYINID